MCIRDRSYTLARSTSENFAMSAGLNILYFARANKTFESFFVNPNDCKAYSMSDSSSFMLSRLNVKIGILNPFLFRIT